MNELINYYAYDPTTKAYTNSGTAEDQGSVPTNSTTIPPIVRISDTESRAMVDPYWDQDHWVEHDPQKLIQETVMQQSQQITILQSLTMKQDQTNAKLQTVNEQQAKQIDQLQQMFMQADQQEAINKSKGETQQ